MDRVGAARGKQPQGLHLLNRRADENQQVQLLYHRRGPMRILASRKYVSLPKKENKLKKEDISSNCMLRKVCEKILVHTKRRKLTEALPIAQSNRPITTATRRKRKERAIQPRGEQSRWTRAPDSML